MMVKRNRYNAPQSDYATQENKLTHHSYRKDKPELEKGDEEQEKSEDPQNRLVPPMASLSRGISRGRGIGTVLREP